MSKVDKTSPLYFDLSNVNNQVKAAFQNMAKGIANEGQQQLVMDYIIYDLCGYYDISFRPGDDGRRETDFSEGKRWVGAKIVLLTKLKLGGTNEV